MYAVIALGGHQYIIKKGDAIQTSKIFDECGKEKVITIDTVLAVYDDSGENILLGDPYVKKAKVLAEVIDIKRNKKIVTVKMFIKNRYHRKRGHKPYYNLLHIKDLIVDE